MPNWCYNKLTIRGPAEEIKRFEDGLLIVDNRHCLLQSYLPCPQKLMDTGFSFHDIGYEAFFNPDPKGYLRVLELPEIKKHGIETRKQLMELVKREYPDSYENGLKINNNLFELGYRNWRWWCTANWGTKWDIYETKFNAVSPAELIFEFESAYSPPVEGLDQIAALFPELNFYLEFDEPMMDFSGFDRWIDGELVEHHFESPPERTLSQ